MDKNKKIISVLLIMGLIFTIMGGTIAYYNWQTTEEQKTLVSFTVSNNFSCSADGGGNITTGDVRIIPTEVNDSTVGNYIKREVKVYPKTLVSGVSIYMDLWLNINELGIGLSNSDNFRYSFTTSSTSPTTGVVSSGNFKGLTTGNKVWLLSSKDYSSTMTDTYYLWIWLDAAETSTETMNQSFSLSLGGNCYDQKLLTATDLVAKANASTLTYAAATDIQKGEMWTFSHEATEQVEATTDYRYIGNNYCSYESGQYGAPINSDGICPKRYNYVRTKMGDSTITNYANQESCPSDDSTYTYECTELTNDGIVGVEPNNYITFNDEVWRIIGIFDGRIKIIRNESLGNMSWDYKKTGVGTSTSDKGSNDWTDSQLMYMLNTTSYKLKNGYTEDGTYIYDGSGNIIYQLGCIPARIFSGDTSYNCNSNTWSLNSTALSQMSEVTYYLGGGIYNSTTHYGTAEEIYAWERGTTRYSIERPTSWTGLVGLMYLSDYAYTFANGVDDTCYTDTYNCKSGTPSSSWLYKSGIQWTISSSSGYSYNVFVVVDNDVIGSYSASNILMAYPVAYLKSDIKLQGSGTSDEPYEIIN